MKNVWLFLVMIPCFLNALYLNASQDTSFSPRQAFGNVLALATAGAGKVNSGYKWVKKADGADITMASMPLWYIHGLFGYNKRLQETGGALLFDRKKLISLTEAPSEYTKYPHFWNRIMAGDVKNFSWLHPIQSIKGNARMCPPLIGPAVSSVLTGFTWHMWNCYPYSKWYKEHGAKLNK